MCLLSLSQNWTVSSNHQGERFVFRRLRHDVENQRNERGVERTALDDDRICDLGGVLER